MVGCVAACLALITFQWGIVLGDVGLLQVLSTNQQFCMQYNSQWTKLSDASIELDAISSNPAVGCTNITNGLLFAGKAVVTHRGDCEFGVKLSEVDHYRGKALIIVNNSTSTFVPNANETIYADVLKRVPMVVITDTAGDLLDSLGGEVKMYELPAKSLDPNCVVFLILAVGCIVIGSLWGTYDERIQARRAHLPLPQRTQGATEPESEDNGVEFTPKLVGAFLIFASTLLVLMYLLYKYLVYVTIVIFTISGSGSIFVCLYSVLCGGYLAEEHHPKVTLPKVGVVSVYAIVLLCCSFPIGICWAIWRKNELAWILQDFMAVCFLISALRVLRISSLKIATLLMGLFLLYDVFFVFITPLFTKHHDSIMVKAATGGSSSTENIPFLIALPHFNSLPCTSGESILGFGDIVIPGILVSFCLAFDYHLIRTKRRAWDQLYSIGRYRYFLVAVFGYSFGLMCTFAALVAMHMAQPALLYLCPSTLGSVALFAWYNGDLKLIWKGLKAKSMENGKHYTVQTNEEDDDEDSDVPMLDDDTSDA